MSIVTSSLNLPRKSDKTNEKPLKEYTNTLSIVWGVSGIAHKVYWELFPFSTNPQGIVDRKRGKQQKVNVYKVNDNI
jgi:hypothetical protein